MKAETRVSITNTGGEIAGGENGMTGRREEQGAGQRGEGGGNRIRDRGDACAAIRRKTGEMHGIAGIAREGNGDQFIPRLKVHQPPRRDFRAAKFHDVDSCRRRAAGQGSAGWRDGPTAQIP